MAKHKMYINLAGHREIRDVESYRFKNDGLTVVKTTDGKTYRTHSSNVIIVTEEDDDGKE